MVFLLIMPIVPAVDSMIIPPWVLSVIVFPVTEARSALSFTRIPTWLPVMVARLLVTVTDASAPSARIPVAAPEIEQLSLTSTLTKAGFVPV
ncbi:hypothetical protein DSECCO2_250300 [anaerobic digester metagenome]